MARSAQRLVAGSQLTTSAATYYTTPANTKAVISACRLTNTSAGAVTATVYLVPSGGTAGASNTVLSAKSLAAGESFDVPIDGQVMLAGGTLQALASSGATITLVASGTEIVE